MPRETILIVDDEKLIRWSMKQKLESWHYQVVEAENLRDAHTKLQQGAALDDIERELIQQALQYTNGNKTMASKLLKISPGYTTIQSKEAPSGVSFKRGDRCSPCGCCSSPGQLDDKAGE